MDRTNLQKKEHKCKVIMVQGTMSGAGKSLVVAGLCRVFAQDGYRVAPFKSQNMALNSYITDEGLEMGRAQVMQAEAAGVRPEVAMNPILLKPTSDSGSQVIVDGRVVGNMTAREYFAHKKKLIPDITKAFEKLADKNDIIVIEGAGSPAEINLKSEDIVNMGMAELVDSNVLLVGDIDRGGVFAQLLGTLMLLEDKEKARVKGLIINKFRGDKTILDPGIEMLGARCDVQVAGVLPYADIRLDDEDSLTSRFDRKDAGLIDIVVIRLPRIANISDFTCFEIIDGVSLRYVDSPDDIASADMVIIPGSKNTIADLKWMRETGIEAAIKKYAKRKDQSEANGYTDSGIVFGICGGYQMLGNNISDPHGIEDGGSIRGMELLPIDTVIENEKTRTRVSGRVTGIDGPLSSLEGCQISGYEIHMGKSTSEGIAIASLTVESDEENNTCMDGAQNGSVYGSYVHGIFDDGDMASKIVRILADRKGVSLGESEVMKYDKYKKKQYDMLADMIRKHMNMELIYSILKDANITTQ